MRIFKYELSILDKQIILLPKKAKILSVQNQNNKVCIWALVDGNIEKDKREILIIGTGNSIEQGEELLYQYTYIGSVQQSVFVWHVFIDKLFAE